MRNIMMFAGLATLVACGYSEDKFADDAAEASCEWTVECYDVYADVDECLADSEDVETDEDCEYDSSAAKECVDGIRAMTCPDEGEFPEFPSACGDVYDCPDEDDTGA